MCYILRRLSGKRKEKMAARATKPKKNMKKTTRSAASSRPKHGKRTLSAKKSSAKKNQTKQNSPLRGKKKNNSKKATVNSAKAKKSNKKSVGSIFNLPVSFNAATKFNEEFVAKIATHSEKMLQKFEALLEQFERKIAKKF